MRAVVVGHVEADTEQMLAPTLHHAQVVADGEIGIVEVLINSFLGGEVRIALTPR